jgi:hypothetical protein
MKYGSFVVITLALVAILLLAILWSGSKKEGWRQKEPVLPLFAQRAVQVYDKSSTESDSTLHSMNASIVRHPYLANTYLMMTRFVNYEVDRNGLLKRNDNEAFITANHYSELGLDFEPTRTKRILQPETNEISHYIGVEDVRVFVHQHKLYFLGSLYNATTNSMEIVSDVLDPYLQNPYKIPRPIEPQLRSSGQFGQSNWEKNWVFFNDGNALRVIYDWFPSLRICEIDYESRQLNLIVEKSVPLMFKGICGSTCGVRFKNHIWFIVHFRDASIKNENNVAPYLHRFVCLDRDMNIVGVSLPFQFENYVVEFCIGLELSYDDKWIVVYSTLDKTTKLAIFEVDTVHDIMRSI